MSGVDYTKIFICLLISFQLAIPRFVSKGGSIKLIIAGLGLNIIAHHIHSNGHVAHGIATIHEHAHGGSSAHLYQIAHSQIIDAARSRASGANSIALHHSLDSIIHIVDGNSCTGNCFALG